MTGDTIGVIVVTHNRMELLRKTIEGVVLQTIKPDRILVVDNASTDSTREMVNTKFPDVKVIRLEENVGAAGGVAVGMRMALSERLDWLWILDDDSLPNQNALELAIANISQPNKESRNIQWINIGGYVANWKARPIPLNLREMAPYCPEPFVVDCADVSQSLISSTLVRDIGFPREDYFMMIWNYEYSLRARRAGYEIWAMPDQLIRDISKGLPSVNARTWRVYYQSRNHLALALEYGSGVEMFWWLMRQLKFIAKTIVSNSQDHKLERIRLRILGGWHAIRGQMGRTIDPAEYES